MEKDDIKKAQTLLDQTYKNIFDTLKNDFEKKYEVVPCLWEGMYSPLENQVDIFSAHSETTKEPMHTAVLADFLADDKLGLLELFIKKYCKDIKWENITAKTITSQCMLYYDDQHEKKCYPDIVITIETVENKYTLVIEGKIYASENTYIHNKKDIKSRDNDKSIEKQIQRYRTAFNRKENINKYGESRFYYLTLDCKKNDEAEAICWMDLLALAQHCIYKYSENKENCPRLHFLQLWIGSFLGYVEPGVSKQDLFGEDSFYYLQELSQILSFLDNARQEIK